MILKILFVFLNRLVEFNSKKLRNDNITLCGFESAMPFILLDALTIIITSFLETCDLRGRAIL